MKYTFIFQKAKSNFQNESYFIYFIDIYKQIYKNFRFGNVSVLKNSESELPFRGREKINFVPGDKF